MGSKLYHQERRKEGRPEKISTLGGKRMENIFKKRKGTEILVSGNISGVCSYVINGVRPEYEGVDKWRYEVIETVERKWEGVCRNRRQQGCGGGGISSRLP